MILNGIETDIKYSFSYLKEDIKNCIKNCKYRARYRLCRAKKRNILFMVVDPYRKNPGLADRFKAMVNLYNMARYNDYEFKIYWRDPFDISEFLIPQKEIMAKWEELDYSLFDTKVFTERNWAETSNFKKGKQYHCYLYAGNTLPNVYLNTGLKWVDLFNELFKPSEEIEEAYRDTGAERGRYISIHLRFVNALEMFEKTFFDNYLETQDEREKLIEKCRNGIMEIVAKNNDCPVYVFSDSKVFLNRIKDLPVRVLLADNIGHSGNTSDRNSTLKSFLDMFTMARGKAVYRMTAKELYNWSEYAKVAAAIGDIPYYEHKI